MKQYYESEVLFQLMERDGLNIPSSVPPYEAEIKAYLINQVKQAYPKLTDYEAEWLLYNYTKHLPADFPISSVTNVRTATFENVVPFAYQSAILKGQTMVNVLTGETKEYSGDEVGYGFFIDFMTIQNLKANTVYTAIFKVETDAEQLMIGITSTLETWNSSPVAYVNGNNKILLTTTTEAAYSLRIRCNDATIKSLVVTNAMLIEGDYTNEDIPYFEGMQSVKMPVLTTSNEDGTKTNILSTPEDIELRGVGDVKDELNCLTGEVVERIGEVVLDGSEEWTFNRETINHNLWLTTIANPALNTFVRKNNMLCNKLIVEDFTGFNDKDYEFISINNGNSNLLYLKLDKTKGSTLTELKNYLQSNPLTVQYQLATESIKTVDLTTVNENGESVHFMPLEGTMHVQSSGEIIKPTFDMSVPVEATIQNLASFIDLEMRD